MTTTNRKSFPNVSLVLSSMLKQHFRSSKNSDYNYEQKKIGREVIHNFKPNFLAVFQLVKQGKVFFPMLYSFPPIKSMDQNGA